MPNLYDRFVERFTPRLAEPFVVRPDESTITYADLHAATGRIANLFLSLGIAPGDRIAMQVDKSAEGLLVYLATLRIGRSICRSTRPTRRASSIISCAMRSRRCSSAAPPTRRCWVRCAGRSAFPIC